VEATTSFSCRAPAACRDYLLSVVPHQRPFNLMSVRCELTGPDSVQTTVLIEYRISNSTFQLHCQTAASSLEQ